MSKDTQSNTASAIRILKIDTCPSLSGKSKLSYEIGCDADSAIHWKIAKNSGGGQFNVEWVAMEKIGKALSASANITSFSLHSVFVGKSHNNGGFLMAALKHEELVLASADEKIRSYQLGDPGKFMAEMQALMEKPIDVPAEALPKKSKKQA